MNGKKQSDHEIPQPDLEGLKKILGKSFGIDLAKGVSETLVKGTKKGMGFMNHVKTLVLFIFLFVLGFFIRPYFDPYLKGLGIAAQLAKIDPDLKALGAWIKVAERWDQEDSETENRDPDNVSEGEHEFVPFQLFMKK